MEHEFENFNRDMADISARTDDYLSLERAKSFKSGLKILKNKEINTVEA